MSMIDTNQLKSALERLCLVVPKRATLPVLENLRWRAAEGHLELTATDLDNHLHISIPFDGEAIDSGVDALVPAKELCQLVKTESAPSLKIRIRNGKCEVSAKKRTLVLSCADPNSFPETPDGKLKPQGQIFGSAFDAALRRALFCVSTESGRYSTDALKLELRGSVFRVVGTDGHRLSVAEGTAKMEGSSTFSALLLHSTATILSRLGLADEPRWVQFSTCGSEQEFNLFVLPDGSRLTTRRGQGQFPNYENVLPKAPLEARVVFRREELLEGLAKLSPTARKAEVPAVKLELSRSPVSIKTESDGTANSVTLEPTSFTHKSLYPENPTHGSPAALPRRSTPAGLRESRSCERAGQAIPATNPQKGENHWSIAAQVVDPQSASLALTLLQSKAGNRWARAVEEMKTNRLRVAGDFPEFIVTNKSGTAYKVKLDPHGSGSCTCPDFQVRIAQDGRICKHIAAAAITRRLHSRPRNTALLEFWQHPPQGRTGRCMEVLPEASPSRWGNVFLGRPS